MGYGPEDTKVWLGYCLGEIRWGELEKEGKEEGENGRLIHNEP